MVRRVARPAAQHAVRPSVAVIHEQYGVCVGQADLGQHRRPGDSVAQRHKIGRASRAVKWNEGVLGRPERDREEAVDAAGDESCERHCDTIGARPDGGDLGRSGGAEPSAERDVERPPVGRVQQRAEFEGSLQQLRDLGLPRWAVECYRRVARVSGQLPHEVVTRVAILGASHILQNPEVAVYPVYEDELPGLAATSLNGRRSAFHRSTVSRKN